MANVIKVVNQDRNQVIRDRLNRDLNHLINVRIIANVMPVQVLAPTAVMINVVKTRMTLKFVKKKMEYKLKDLIEKQIKMIAAVIAIRVVRGNPAQKDAVFHRERIETDPKTEIDLVIDHVIALEGMQ